jgi:hypothetical protein
MVKKGETKRVWTAEQKPEIVHKHLDEHLSIRRLEKEYTADRSMINTLQKENLSLSQRPIQAIRLLRFMLVKISQN